MTTKTHKLLLLSRPAIALLTFLLFVGCYRQVEQDLLLHIPEMQSTTCAGVIQEALSRLDGIVGAYPDVQNQTVLVRFDSEKIAIKNIEFVVAGTGFAVNDEPASPEGRAKLPKECQ